MGGSRHVVRVWLGRLSVVSAASLIALVAGAAQPAAAATAGAVKTFGPGTDSDYVSIGCVPGTTTGACLAVGGNAPGWVAPVVSGTPGPVTSGANGGMGAACETTTVCVAVGQNMQSIGTGVIQLFSPDGFLTETISGGAIPVLSAVACESSTGCLAVGEYEPDTSPFYGGIQALGPKGQLGAALQPAGVGGLFGVACGASTSCVAVGVGTTGVAIVLPITVDQSGVPHAATPEDVQGAIDLNGVACESATTCFAVGDATPHGGGPVQAAVVPITNGTPGVVMFGPLVTSGSVLAGVACATATSCVAVGNDSSTGLGLIVPITGGVVGTALSVNTGALGGVACSAPASCWAIGFNHPFGEGYGDAVVAIDPAGHVATTASLTASPAPSTYGRSVTFTATIAPASGAGMPLGSVTFTDGSRTLGTGSLTAGTAALTTSLLAGGVHTITARFSGDTNFTGSSATLKQTVNRAPTKLVAAAASKTTKRLSATLTRTTDSAAVAGQKIVFSTKSPFTGKQDVACTAVTSTSGVATCTGAIPGADLALDSSYTATFAQTANYLASSSTASLR